MALVTYSSSSDGSDIEPTKPKLFKADPVEDSRNEEANYSSEKMRLPLPSAISCMNKVIHPVPIDDPAKHDGRIRTFEHERGNWATLVYIPVELCMIDEIASIIKSSFENCPDLMMSVNIHISLTKTVVLRHHWIDLFIKSIDDALIDADDFRLEFQSFNVYVNEERTRTFIGLVAGNIYFEKLFKLMLKMDRVMKDFRLDTFYEDPSFHASVLWCVGDYEDVFKSRLSTLNRKFANLRNMYTEEFRIRVDRICCRAGNKYFDFDLK